MTDADTPLDPDEYVEFEMLPDQMTAILVRDQLTTEGIAARIPGLMAIDHFASTVQGVEGMRTVAVPRRDLERARKVVDQMHAAGDKLDATTEDDSSSGDTPS